MASFDRIEWDDSEPESSSEPEAQSEPEADPYDVPISMRSSSDWEAVNTPDATFLGVHQLVLAARIGVRVPSGTYSWS